MRFVEVTQEESIAFAVLVDEGRERRSGPTSTTLGLGRFSTSGTYVSCLDQCPPSTASHVSHGCPLKLTVRRYTRAVQRETCGILLCGGHQDSGSSRDTTNLFSFKSRVVCETAIGRISDLELVEVVSVCSKSSFLGLKCRFC